MDQQIKAIYENGVLRPLDRVVLNEHAVVRLTVSADLEESGAANGKRAETFGHAAIRLGLVGCATGGLTDLSTNPKYLEGFGKPKL